MGLTRQELLHFARALASFPKFRGPEGEEHHREVAQLAWVLASDFYLSPACTLHAATTIAVAALAAAVVMTGHELQPDWWHVFAPVSEAELQTILQAMVAVYRQHRTQAEEPG